MLPTTLLRALGLRPRDRQPRTRPKPPRTSTARRRAVVPRLVVLEDRTVPALSVTTSHGSLIITGTPVTTGDDFTNVQYVGNDNYQVIDAAGFSPVDLGTFHVTRDIRVNLVSKDGAFLIDLGDDTLTGNIAIDVGLGDTDLSTFAPTVLGSFSAGPGKVTGNVSFIARSGGDYFGIFGGSPYSVEIDGNVRGDSPVTPVFNPDNGPGNFDLFGSPLEPGTLLVHGNVTANGFGMVQMEGTTIDGNLKIQERDSPIDSNLHWDNNTIHGNFTFLGAASPSTNVGGFFDSDGITIDGNATITLRDTAAVVPMDGATIGGNMRVSAGSNVSSSVFMGNVGGNAIFDLGGSASTSSDLVLNGSVGGSMSVLSNSGAVHITISSFGSIDDGLVVLLGNGTNALTIQSGAHIGDSVLYKGGTGADTVTINGQHTFALFVFTGGGDDTVAFAPDARVGFALIDFGKKPGNKHWIPPLVIDFDLVLLNYP